MIATSTAVPKTLPITLPPQRERESGPAAQWSPARPGGFADKLDRLGERKPADRSAVAPPSRPVSVEPRPMPSDATTRENAKLKQSQETDVARRARPTVQERRVDDPPPSDPSAPLPELAGLAPGGEITSDRAATATPVVDSDTEKAALATEEPWWAALLPQSPLPTPTPVSSVERSTSTMTQVDVAPIMTTEPQDGGEGIDIYDTRTRKLAAEAAESAATEKLGAAGVGAAHLPRGTSTPVDADRQAQDAARKLPGAVQAENGAREISLDPSSANTALTTRGQTADAKTLGADEPSMVAFATAPGTISGPSAAAAAVPARLSAPPGSPDFAAQLGTALTAFVRQGVHHARLELNPAEMGPLTVQIQLDGDHAQVHLAAEHAQTRLALEQSMPHLAGSLREAGLTLTGGGVSDRAPRQPPLPPDWEDDNSHRARRDRLAGLETDVTIGGAGSVQPVLPGRTGGRRGVVDLVA